MLLTPAVVDFGEVGALIVAFFMFAIIPLVWMLLYHQRKMAAFLHGTAQSEAEKTKIDRLEAEIRELKDRINQMILLTDNRRELQERVMPPELPEQKV